MDIKIVTGKPNPVAKRAYRTEDEDSSLHPWRMDIIWCKSRPFDLFIGMKYLSLYYQLFLVSIAIGILIVGCNKTPTTGPTALIKMNGQSVKAHLDENNIVNDCGKVTHKDYYVPTRQWITDKLVPYWATYRNRNNLMYDVNTTSCEAFSFQCHFASQEIEKYNITVGVFFYTPDKYVGTGIGHAINVIEINENDKVQIVFFEPQTSQIVTLSNTELASCSFFYF
jgi:hypothetical protein